MGSESLQPLFDRAQLWRGRDRRGGGAATEAFMSSGHAMFDAALGGWPKQALTEVLIDDYGIGELSLLMPALKALSQGERWIAWVDAPYTPYAPALQSAGLDVSRVLLVHSRGQQQRGQQRGQQRQARSQQEGFRKNGSRKNDYGKDGLWAAEQALRSGTCAAVLLWLDEADERAIRRLQLAAEQGSSWGILFRPGACARQGSPAAMRLSLKPGDAQQADTARTKEEGSESRELAIEVIKQRGAVRASNVQLGLPW